MRKASIMLICLVFFTPVSFCIDTISMDVIPECYIPGKELSLKIYLPDKNMTDIKKYALQVKINSQWTNIDQLFVGEQIFIKTDTDNPPGSDKRKHIDFTFMLDQMNREDILVEVVLYYSVKPVAYIRRIISRSEKCEIEQKKIQGM